MATGSASRRAWSAALAPFATASATLAEDRTLQRRVDSKFVMPVADALALVSPLRHDYAVLPAGGVALATYRSLYFDGPDLQLFHDHRRGRRLRQKVRVRHYPERQVSFLEIKLRTGDAMTTKVRRPRPFGSDNLDDDDADFVREHCRSCQTLVPQVWVAFKRVTLLATADSERVTIDLDLEVRRDEAFRRFVNTAIVEVKQARPDRTTRAMQILRAWGCRSGWASKYCAAVVLTCHDVRAARLQASVRSFVRGEPWAI